MTFTIYKANEPDKLIRVGHGLMPPPSMKNQRGRKKMSEDEKKLSHETGVKKISEEPADKQGPIGADRDADPPIGNDAEGEKADG